MLRRVHLDNAADASSSQTVTDNRWNTLEFPALYCCCSLRVAQAVARTSRSWAGLELRDLTPEMLPALREITWGGQVVDMASAEGIREAGFPPDYPANVPILDTQAAATRWHAEKREGVVCRSNALWLLRAESEWIGTHEPWGEVAVFVKNTAMPPVAARRYVDLVWLEGQLLPE